MPDAWGGSFGSNTCNVTTGVCGTGGWTGPKPGDPDNNVVLSANGMYGYVQVYWTYPSTNAHAVMHTLLFRSTQPSFDTAIQIRVEGGNSYADKFSKADIRPYYYWIKLVSVNGTVGDLIGPASATPLDAALDTLEGLTGLIDSGVLAQSLKKEITEISLLRGDLSAESLTRFQNNQALADALAEVLSDTGEAKALLVEEITQRTNGDEALLSQLNVMATGMNSNLAAIVEEQTVQATATEAYADSIQALVGRVDTAAAAIQNESTLRVNADSSLANQIATAQSSLGNNIASVQTNLQTNINTLGGKVTSIGALYTAKVSVNGLIGGFGVYNDGATVEAGFDVDRFWVGRTNADKVKPFIISNGVTYIDKARIKTADIDTLKIEGNAVTVPTVGTQSGQSLGNGSYANICSATVSNIGNDRAMPVIILAGGTAGYGAGIKLVGFKIVHQGIGTVAEVAGISGDYVTTPNLTGYSSVPAGATATYTFCWYAADSTVGLTNSNIIVLGAKR